MKVGQHEERIEFAVTDLGTTHLFLGHEWLKRHNPSIDWSKGTLQLDQCPEECGFKLRSVVLEEEEEPDYGVEWVRNVRFSPNRKPENIPAEYLAEFPEVFSKKEFDKLPERRPWDHAIDLIPGSKPVDCKAYPLGAKDRAKLDKFLEENL